MSSTRFEALLERTMGLVAASIGASAIARAVTSRISANDVDGEDAYWDFLQRSPEELQELVEAVIVPETWFFRDPESFAAMARIARDKASKAHARPLRLLSLPCSSGEEAYTLAMALLDAGLRADDFRIDAVDISARSLALARLGVYGRNSFRSQDLSFRNRYFEPAGRVYRVDDAIRAPVHFLRGNMLDADFLAGADPYDIIFCRNLLIYFDGPTQSRAIGVLKRLLAPEGVLFAGHSETGLMPANGFVSARIPMAFAFRAASEMPVSGNFRPPATPARPIAKAQPVRRVPVKPLRMSAVRHEPTSSMRPSSIDDLRRLADSGRLEEAARGCEKHIRDCGSSAPALLLLALISDASGNPLDAAQHYRGALYLEPDNAEALEHLALLLRKQGDHAGAKLLDDRMRRCLNRRAG